MLLYDSYLYVWRQLIECYYFPCVCWHISQTKFIIPLVKILIHYSGHNIIVKHKLVNIQRWHPIQEGLSTENMYHKSTQNSFENHK